jgi:hypothetical protein
MAAKGTILKNNITNEILRLFPGSFIYNKEIRIPGIEENENIQIKCVLTCAKVNVEDTAAKTNVERDSDVDIPGAQVESVQFADAPTVSTAIEPSEEEKQNVAELVARLGL